MQCPSFLVCVGREPSHPSFVENFRKTSDDKLPKLNVRSSSSGCNEGVGGMANILLTQISFLNIAFNINHIILIILTTC